MEKTHLVLELIEKKYNKYFDFIIIICPTLRENYHAKEWIKNDDSVWLVDPKDKLYQWIKKLSELLRFKRRQPLLELFILGRHWGHYLWLLTVLFGHTKKIEGVGQGYFCLVSKGKGRSKNDT